MIVDGILSIVFEVVEGVFSVLPNIHLDISSGMYRTFLDIVASVAYLFPLGTLMSIFALVCSFILFKFFITVIRMLWDLLPIV